MNIRYACSLLALLMLTLLIVGCSQPADDSQVIEQTVTVTTSSGDEKVVPLAELYDQTSGAPAFDTVLVVDRQRNRKVFVSPDELKGQTQANARYVLVTSSLEMLDSDAE